MRSWRAILAWRVSAVVALTASLTAGLPGSFYGGPAPLAQAASGVSLLPAAGQFNPLSGTAVLDTRNGTGLTNPSLTPGSTLTFSVRTVGGASTGVPADASAVVMEFNALGNFTGVLSGGADGGSTDTSLTFAANTERNGFDIITPAADGTVALTITAFSPIPSNAVMSKIVVRLHGYYTGATASTAGSTYVGYDPALLADSSASPSGFTLSGTPTSGPLVIGVPSGQTVTNPYTVQVTGNAGVPADGSATAVAIQAIVQNPTCTGGFALVPNGSGRTDWDGTFGSGVNDENFDLIALPANGQLTLRLTGCSGTATVLLRVRGYYTAPTSSTPGSGFTPVKTKVFDTTTGTGTGACPSTTSSPQLAPHSGCSVTVLGVGSIPASGVSGVGAEVVAVGPGYTGWLGLYSDDTVAHTATLWYGADGRTSNFEIASYTRVGSGGTVYVWNGGDHAVDVVVRVHGYFRSPQAPDAPASVTRTATDASGTATVTWTAPATDGGAAVTGYQVLSGNAQVLATVDAGTRSATVSGLDPVNPDLVGVAAVNALGTGLVGDDTGTVAGTPVTDAPTSETLDAPLPMQGTMGDLPDDPGDTFAPMNAVPDPEDTSGPVAPDTVTDVAPAVDSVALSSGDATTTSGGTNDLDSTSESTANGTTSGVSMSTGWSKPGIAEHGAIPADPSAAASAYVAVETANSDMGRTGSFGSALASRNRSDLSWNGRLPLYLAIGGDKLTDAHVVFDTYGRRFAIVAMNQSGTGLFFGASAHATDTGGSWCKVNLAGALRNYGFDPSSSGLDWPQLAYDGRYFLITVQALARSGNRRVGSWFLLVDRLGMESSDCSHTVIVKRGVQYKGTSTLATHVAPVTTRISTGYSYFIGTTPGGGSHAYVWTVRWSDRTLKQQSVGIAGYRRPIVPPNPHGGSFSDLVTWDSTPSQAIAVDSLSSGSTWITTSFGSRAVWTRADGSTYSTDDIHYLSVSVDPAAGTLRDKADRSKGDRNWFYYSPSLAMSGNGTLGVALYSSCTCTNSDGDQFAPDTTYIGLSGEYFLSSTSPARVLYTWSTTQYYSESGSHRWGDFTTVAYDPNPNTSSRVMLVGERPDGTGGWTTQMVSLSVG